MFVGARLFRRNVSFVARRYDVPTLRLPSLETPDARASLVQGVQNKMELSPLFFASTRIAIESSSPAPPPVDQVVSAVSAMSSLGVHILGLGSGFTDEHAEATGVPLLLPSKGGEGGESGQAGGEKAGEEEAGKAADLSGSLVHTGSVRSGQQVYAQGRDLVVMGSANTGSELMADGDIHVYGKLRGKALAGLAGNTNARIFCMAFDPELVAIGDLYVMSADLPEVHVCDSPLIVSGSGDGLQFTPFQVKATAV